MPLGKARQQGFTLIELSIVLVIIGLIIGGVLVGKDLIRAAEIRKVITEKERFVTAVYTFKSKYNCLPGDCPNATDFFGTDPEGCSTTYRLDHKAKIETCNGNGDEVIGMADNDESWTFWQQLSDANLVSGLYTGTFSSTGNAVGNVNCPSIAGNSNFCWYVVSPQTDGMGDQFIVQPTSINIIWMYNSGHDGFFTAQEALAFDRKYDDGSPVTGKVQAVTEAYIPPGCVTAQDATAQYYTTDTGRVCTFWFPAGF